jgi:hypothetical protein
MSTRKERQARIGLWVLAAFGKEQAASLPHRGIRAIEAALLARKKRLFHASRGETGP